MTHKSRPIAFVSFLLTATISADALAQAPSAAFNVPVCTQPGKKVGGGNTTCRTSLGAGQPVQDIVPPGLDPRWTVTQTTGVAPGNPSCARQVGGWYVPGPGGGAWAQPPHGGTPGPNVSGAPAGDYTYTLTFNIASPLASYQSIRFAGAFTAGSPAVVKVNGTQLAACPVGTSYVTCLRSRTKYATSDRNLFVQGDNTLAITVSNPANGRLIGLYSTVSLTATCPLDTDKGDKKNKK